MSRNLVICCDGTNNRPAGRPTNVCHLSRLADVADETRQRVFHDASRTDADPRLRTRIGGALSRWSGTAFGTGIVENVARAYRELIQSHSEGDRVFLFGVARGAYTVRALAGLVHNYGLLRRENELDAAHVVRAYQELYPPTGDGFVNGLATPGQQARLDKARRIRTMRSVACPIHFMGLFDAVSSLGWVRDPKPFPNTLELPNVGILRHALALDERRAKSRAHPIVPAAGADHRQAWFAGARADGGGGRPEPREQLSRGALRWMLDEAMQAGMLVNETVLAQLDLESAYRRNEQAGPDDGADPPPRPHENPAQNEPRSLS